MSFEHKTDTTNAHSNEIEEGEIPEETLLVSSKPKEENENQLEENLPLKESPKKVKKSKKDKEYKKRSAEKSPGRGSASNSDFDEDDYEIIQRPHSELMMLSKMSQGSKGKSGGDDDSYNSNRNRKRVKYGSDYQQEKYGGRPGYENGDGKQPPMEEPVIPCIYYVGLGKCEDNYCKAAHRPIVMEHAIRQFIRDHEDFFRDLYRRRNELQINPAIRRYVEERFAPQFPNQMPPQQFPHTQLPPQHLAGPTQNWQGGNLRMQNTGVPPPPNNFVNRGPGQNQMGQPFMGPGGMPQNQPGMIRGPGPYPQMGGNMPNQNFPPQYMPPNTQQPGLGQFRPPNEGNPHQFYSPGGQMGFDRPPMGYQPPNMGGGGGPGPIDDRSGQMRSGGPSGQDRGSGGYHKNYDRSRGGHHRSYHSDDHKGRDSYDGHGHGGRGRRDRRDDDYGSRRGTSDQKYSGESKHEPREEEKKSSTNQGESRVDKLTKILNFLSKSKSKGDTEEQEPAGGAGKESTQKSFEIPAEGPTDDRGKRIQDFHDKIKSLGILKSDSKDESKQHFGEGGNEEGNDLLNLYNRCRDEDNEHDY